MIIVKDKIIENILCLNIKEMDNYFINFNKNLTELLIQLNNLIGLGNIIEFNKKFNFFDHIDQIYYINLKHRTDRKTHIINEIKKIDPNLEHTTRFEAIIYDKPFKKTDIRNKGSIGCSLSHIEIAKIARKNNYKNILILEDDCKINVKIEEFNRLMEYFFKNIKSFNFLLLGASIGIKFITVDKELSYVVKADCTTGYILNNSIYDDWIDTAEKQTKIMIDTGKRSDCVIDDVWDKYNKDGMRYTFNNNKRKLAIQIAGYSDIELKKISGHS